MNKQDTFFSQKNCDRCGQELFVRIMSWFTTDTICDDCHDKEIKIKKELESQGVNVNSLEGCGYVPNPEDFEEEEFLDRSDIERG